jgi:hypothetical protein
LSGGSAFQNVGFHYGTGGVAATILYELLDDGAVVLSGSAPLTGGANYLGFSGGGFDTIRLRDTQAGAGGSVTDGSYQGLAVDNIEIQGANVAPEPSSLALLGLGAAGLLDYAGKRRKKAAR